MTTIPLIPGTLRKGDVVRFSVGEKTLDMRVQVDRGYQGASWVLVVQDFETSADRLLLIEVQRER